MSDRLVPTQIAASAGNSDNPDILYALCPDGSMWRLAIDEQMHWERLPDIPNDAPISPDNPAEVRQSCGSPIVVTPAENASSCS